MALPKKASGIPVYGDMLRTVAWAGMESLPVFSGVLAFTPADLVRKTVIRLPENGCSRGGAMFCRDLVLGRDSFDLFDRLLSSNLFADFDEPGWMRKLSLAHVHIRGFADLSAGWSSAVYALRGSIPGEETGFDASLLDRLSGNAFGKTAEFRTGFTYSPDEAEPVFCFSALSLSFEAPEPVRFFVPFGFATLDLPDSAETFHYAMESVVVREPVPSAAPVMR